MTTQFLHANHLRLAYEQWGERANPTVLLIAGLGCQLIEWPDSFCQGLVDKGYQVVRFDNRDIGLSDKIEGAKAPSLLTMAILSALRLPIRAPYQLEDMAADAVGVLDALNIKQAHIVGFSMGGMIAQLIAANYPERVFSLTSIMSSSGKRSLPAADKDVINAVTKKAKTPEQAFNNAFNTWRLIGSPAYQPTDEQLSARLLASAKRNSYPAGFIRQMSAIMANGSRVRALKKIEVPTLVIHGKADRLVPVEGGIDTAYIIKDARLEIFEGMGHDFPEVLVPKFVELICDNIQRT